MIVAIGRRVEKGRNEKMRTRAKQKRGHREDELEMREDKTGSTGRARVGGKVRVCVCGWWGGARFGAGQDKGEDRAGVSHWEIVNLVIL